MEELTNDKQLAKLTKKYGSEKVEAEYEKFNSILQNKKINYVISFIWVLLAYILSYYQQSTNGLFLVLKCTAFFHY